VLQAPGEAGGPLWPPVLAVLPRREMGCAAAVFEHQVRGGGRGGGQRMGQVMQRISSGTGIGMSFPAAQTDALSSDKWLPTHEKLP